MLLKIPRVWAYTPIKDEGGDDPVMAQTGEEGQGLPVTVRDLGQESLSPWAPSAQTRHVGLNPGFVDEDQARGIKPVLMGFPAMAQPRYPRPILLLGHQRFF